MIISTLRFGSTCVAFFWLAACGSADEPRKPPPPLEETVFRDVAVTPIEKAKNVENIVMEQKRQTDKAVERNESDQ